VKVFKKHT